MITLHWPWALLALPLPWLLPRWLPAAPPTVQGALWLPFFHALPGLRPVTNPVTPGLRLGSRIAWISLILALARPAFDDTEWFRWPLGLSLVIACLIAYRLTRPPPHYRSLPTHHRHDRRGGP